MPRLSDPCPPRAAALLVCAALAVLVAPSPAAAVTRDELAAYSAGAQGAWVALTDADGAVTDPLEPDFGRFNYGTLMLANAQLHAARRTGDDALGSAAVAQMLGSIQRDRPQDPFHLLAAASTLREGRAGAYRTDDWRRLSGSLADWVGSFRPYTERDFANPARYSNLKLIWATGAMALVRSGVSARRPDAIAADHAALRAEVRRIVSELAPLSAGPHARSPGRAPLRALSDRVLFPNAYHVLSVYLLERIHALDPSVFTPEALALREEAGRYTLALMAPDGQLTHSGRSAEQSWVLAAAAAYGARRAAEGGSRARSYSALAQRAAGRLLALHAPLGDGTIPVVPGLRLAWDPAIMDAYASQTQYNGLTLMLLEDAVAHWRDDVAAARLPADRSLLVEDFDGSGLAWGAHGAVWWALSGRGTRSDPRYEQGLVALKYRRAGHWHDLLASRPVAGGPSTQWRLRTRRGPAILRLTRASGSGAHARLHGTWRLRRGARELRRATVGVRVSGRRLVLSVALRRGEQLIAPVWSSAPRTGRRHDRCVVSASGRACPTVLRLSGRRARVTLGAPRAERPRRAPAPRN